MKEMYLRVSGALLAVIWLISATQPLQASERPTTIDAFYEAGGSARVIAHRGFSSAAPENTLAAVRAAIDVGADMAEIDVTLTSDGQVVVIHDATLQRTTNGGGEVLQFSLADLRQLDAGSWFSKAFAGEPIPTLDAMLAEVDDRILLNVEIKSEAVGLGVVEKVAAAIRVRGMTNEIIVSSFSPTALEKMHQLAPEIRTAVLYNKDLHVGMDPVEIVTGVGASAFNIKRVRLTPEMLRRCHENGIPVAVYTVNKKRHLRKAVDLGVDAIFTDRPDRLLEVLAKRQASDPAPALVPAPVNP
jgi:glycerophosphoryl diester phosphodiesterase